MHLRPSIEDRPVANRRWNLWRGAVGLFYVAAAILNLALAALQGLLLFRRYPRPIWRPAPPAPPDAERTAAVITRAERA
jgi:hypothetical protein